MKSLVGIGKGLEKSGRLFLEYGDANGSFWVFWGVPKNGTWGARIKIPRPLFNTNTPPKTPA